MKKQLRGVFAVLVMLTMAACTDSETDVPADPRAALTASVAGLQAGNYTFRHATTYQVIDGTVLAPSDSLQIKLDSKVEGQQFTSDFVRVAGRRYVLLDFSRVENMTSNLPEVMTGRKWIPLEDAAVAELGGIPFPAPTDDVSGAVATVNSIVTASSTAEGAYSGTLDLTKVGAGVLRIGPTADLLTQLGALANAVPFTAALDSEGRLTSLTYDIPAAGKVPANHVELTFTGYGAAAAPVAPDPANVADYDEAMKALNQG